MASIFSQPLPSGHAAKEIQNKPKIDPVPPYNDPPVSDDLLSVPIQPSPRNHIVHSDLVGQPNIVKHVLTDDSFKSAINTGNYRDNFPKGVLDDKNNLHVIYSLRGQSFFYSNLPAKSRQWSNRQQIYNGGPANYIPNRIPQEILYAPLFGGVVATFYDAAQAKTFIATQTSGIGTCNTQGWNCDALPITENGQHLVQPLSNGNLYFVFESTSSSSTGPSTYTITGYEIAPPATVVSTETIFRAQNNIQPNKSPSLYYHLRDLIISGNDPIVFANIQMPPLSFPSYPFWTSSYLTSPVLLQRQGGSGSLCPGSSLWRCTSFQYKIPLYPYYIDDFELSLENGNIAFYYLFHEPTSQNSDEYTLYKVVNGIPQSTLEKFDYPFLTSPLQQYEQVLDVQSGLEGVHIAVTDHQGRIRYYLYKGPGLGICGPQKEYAHCRTLTPYGTSFAPNQPDLAVM